MMPLSGLFRNDQSVVYGKVVRPSTMYCRKSIRWLQENNPGVFRQRCGTMRHVAPFDGHNDLGVQQLGDNLLKAIPRHVQHHEAIFQKSFQNFFFIFDDAANASFTSAQIDKL